MTFDIASVYGPRSKGAKVLMTFDLASVYGPKSKGAKGTNAWNSKKMKIKKYHTVRTIPKSNIKIAKSIPPTHKYMTAHFPGYVQALQ